jgi:uncharacterized protein (TIGR00369 family)
VSAFSDPDAGRSVTRYVGVTLRELPEEGVVEGTIPHAPHVAAPHGGPHAGLLLAAIDSVGGVAGGLTALPGWVVSTNLVTRLVPGVAAGALRLRARVARAGRSSVVTAVEGRLAATGALVADAVLTSAVLEPAGGPPRYARPLLLSVPVGPEALPRPEAFFGIRAAGASAVELDVTDAVRNPWGILHGGVTTTLLDAAVARALGSAAITSVVIHFLSPGRVGPVVAAANVIGTRADGSVLRVEVRDRGVDDRLLAVAIVTAATWLREPGPA